MWRVQTLWSGEPIGFSGPSHELSRRSSAQHICQSHFGGESPSPYIAFKKKIVSWPCTCISHSNCSCKLLVLQFRGLIGMRFGLQPGWM